MLAGSNIAVLDGVLNPFLDSAGGCCPGAAGRDSGRLRQAGVGLDRFESGLEKSQPRWWAAIGLAVEAELKALGERRGRPKAAGENISQNFGELFGKKNYEVAADKAGFGNKDTYRQAKTVVQNASPELIDASLLEFSEDYAPLAVIQEPKWRVRALLTKLDSDRKHGTDFGNKFVAKVVEIFSGLPKPKDWLAFLHHDLPLLFTANEVQQFALAHKLNKAQTKAVDMLQKAALLSWAGRRPA